MLPTITEGIVPTVERYETGLWSFDRAVGNKGEYGLPLRTITELYGYEHSGKSTFAYYLLGAIRPEGKVGIVDFETSIDPEYLPVVMSKAGYTGEVKIIDYAIRKKDKKIERPHEDQAQEAAELLLEEETNGICIDSLGMWASQQEKEGDIGEAFWGKRAKAIAQFSRKCLSYLQLADQGQLVIAINHSLPTMGGRGHYTPGGVTKSFAAGVRLMMWRKDSDFALGAFHATIKVEKLRFGGAHKKRMANVFIIPGYGISREMTAVLDCVDLKLAERGASVKIGGESAGRINTLVKAAANNKDLSRFKPFFDALKEVKDE